MRQILAAAVLVLASPSPAAALPTEATVQLSNFQFAPATLVLQASTPVILHLRNLGGGGHSFDAPAFFAAARLDPGSAALVHNGKVEVPGHATVTLSLTPAAGRYPLRCSHTLHSTFGMKGTITVN